MTQVIWILLLLMAILVVSLLIHQQEKHTKHTINNLLEHPFREKSYFQLFWEWTLGKLMELQLFGDIIRQILGHGLCNISRLLLSILLLSTLYLVLLLRMLDLRLAHITAWTLRMLHGMR